VETRAAGHLCLPTLSLETLLDSQVQHLLKTGRNESNRDWGVATNPKVERFSVLGGGRGLLMSFYEQTPTERGQA
jgi:hypothetical protein